MFIKAIKYLLLSLVTLLFIAVALLTYEPVTKALLQKSLSHLLEVDASVEEATLSIHGLQSSGHLNGDAFVLDAKMYTYDSATVTLHYDGDVNTFSSVATVELPHIKTLLDATFNTDTRYLELNASLLKGTLWADLSLERWDYHYQFDALDITAFNSQQKGESNVTYYRPANYFEGQLSAEGKGIIEAPYTVMFHLTTEDLLLDKNLTHQISAELEAPFPFVLDLNGSVDTNRLKADAALASSFLETNVSDFLYDFNRSILDLHLSLSNKREDIIPVKAAFLDFNSSIGTELNASYLLTVDDYSIHTRHLMLDFNTSDLTLDYRLSSLQTRPVNLQGKNVLFGDISYGNDNLSLKIDSRSIKSPILLTLKDNQLHLISNNISLAALQDMANQEALVKGTLYTEIDANLSHEPILWRSTLTSKDIQLPLKYRKDIGLNNDLSLTLKVNNKENGDIIVRPALWSNIATVYYSALRYIPAKELLFFNINAKKVKTSYYRTPRLNLKGSLNLKKERLNKTVLRTPYEKVIVKNIFYGQKVIQSRFDLDISRLDRFGALNPNYELNTSNYLKITDQGTTLDLLSPELGRLTLRAKDEGLFITGESLPIEEAMELSDQPVLMEGALDYELIYTPSSIKAKVTSQKLSGLGDLNNSIRPFSLDFSTALKHHKTRYYGEATLHTDNETFEISDVMLDLSQQKVKSHYRLNIKALEKNTFILPPELKGRLQLYGELEQDQYQHMTLNFVDFPLPTLWHKKLDVNATTPLETNATVKVYNDKGILNFDADIDNTLLDLTLKKSTYNLKNGDFRLHTTLKTELWLKETNLTATGNYDKGVLSIPQADIATAHLGASLSDMTYSTTEQNLTTAYNLHLKTYPDAPYHSDATIYGLVKTRPTLYATIRSDSLGGLFDGYVTEKRVRLQAKGVSVPKLIAFSGQTIPISTGSLDAEVDLYSPALLEANLSTLQGQSDINITDMVLDGIELDTSLNTLRESQDLNLFQGSFSELPIVRSVKEIPSHMTKESSNQTRFGKIRLYTDINSSGLHCQDCAVATEENLIAFKGGIDLERQTFEQFYVGVLFPNNCAYFIQQIEGNLSEPQVELAAAGFKVVGGAAKSLVGNVGTVLDFGAGVIKETGSVVGDAAHYVPVVGDKADKALTTITDVPKDGTSSMTSCIPFYTGRVQHPKNLLSTD